VTGVSDVSSLQATFTGSSHKENGVNIKKIEIVIVFNNAFQHLKTIGRNLNSDNNCLRLKFFDSA
jgi:hypothetical protein